MFNFTSLLGAQSASTASQSLLEFEGGIKVLIDVGWDSSFDAGKLRELERQIPTLSFILLTHATVPHIAAYAHCCKHFPLFTRIPVYATTPVISLGRTLLQDLYASTPLASSIIPDDALSESAFSFPAIRNGGNPHILLHPPTPEEIASYFSLIHPLKYSQPHQPIPSPFSPPLNGLTITAFSAGHTLGGTIWHIQHGLESVVYAVDWNHAREHVFPEAAWLGGAGASRAEVIDQLRRPTAMVCSSRGAMRMAIKGGRKRRDEVLLSMIRETISQGGTVLIPCDSSARVLELAYLLEAAWQSDAQVEPEQGSLKGARLYLASSTCGTTMRYARSMLEWMEEEIVREFEAGGQASHGAKRAKPKEGSSDSATMKDGKDEQKSAKAPFDFKYLKLLERKSQINRMLSQATPRVILASDSSFEWGFSKEALRRIAGDSRNLVVLTERAGSSTNSRADLGRVLWDLWQARQESTADDLGGDNDGVVTVDPKGEEIAVSSVQTAPLVGNELSMYQQYLARQRQLQNTLQGENGSAMETSADVVDDRSSSTSTTSEDSDVEHQGKVLNVTAALAHSRHKLGLSDAELGINILLRRKETYDFDTRGKKGRDKMFPFVAKRRRGDEFGDIIRPEEYLRAEERDEADDEGMRNSGTKKESTVGHKRKWEDTAPRAGAAARRAPNGTTKRRKTTEPKDGLEDNTDSGDRMMTDGEGDTEASDASDTEATATKPEGPLKAIFANETLRLVCRIAYVDFAGLHDKRSVQMLIPRICPRKLILVSGEELETQEFAAECRDLLAVAAGGEASENKFEVLTPVVGRPVDASVDTYAWSVRLSQQLVRRLQWQHVRGLGVVALTGRLEGAHIEDDEDIAASDNQSKPAPDQNGDVPGTEASRSTEVAIKAMPILDITPANVGGAARLGQPLHVGDLRLADLRKILISSGLSADFKGEGTLLVNGMVAVRKSGTGRIEVEGSGFGFSEPKHLDGTFYTVKKKVYEGLAVVAGG